MTFIQPSKRSDILTLTLWVFSAGLVAAIFGMVALYNATVNLDHNITQAKAELDAIGAQNTGFNNTIVGVLSSNEIATLAAKDGLVPESKPTYVPIGQATDQKWPIASHY